MNLKSVMTVTTITLFAISALNAKAQELPQSLTENQLSDLRIHSSRSIQLTPGDTILLKIKAWMEETYPPFLEDVAVKAEWSVTPNIGVKLNRHSGELHIEKTAEPGAEFTITAVFKLGEHERKIQNTLHIYTSTSNPFVGTWSDSRIGVNELIFRADGTFSFTAFPFEAFKDYWGMYSYDLEKKIIQFEVTGGNNIPKDTKFRGSYRFSDNDILMFSDFYFGTFNESFKKSNRYNFNNE